MVVWESKIFVGALYLEIYVGRRAEMTVKTRMPQCKGAFVRDTIRKICDRISVEREMICKKSNGERNPKPVPLNDREKSSDSCNRSRTRGSIKAGMSSRTRCSICLCSM